jgi:preprotein translocase subunit SecG
MKQTFKQDKGVAGLTILLSVIVLLFVIGLLVMIFAIMGGKLQDSSADKLTAGTVANETVTTPTSASGSTLAKASLRDGACGTITSILNGTTGNVPIGLGNFTQTGCKIVNTTSMATYGTSIRVSYPYTYSADNLATGVMNDTTSSVAGVTDWFDIFIVITAMVVLILLTVIIITSIRSSGMIAGAGSQQNSVGTA